MKGGKRHQGYTIVEVMVVLAVSGVMFVIAASFVSGKQAKTAFNQGVTTLASDIQGNIESVVDGQYTDIPLSCSINAGAPRTLSFTSGTAQGTNPACTFLGELIHFRPADTATDYDLVYLAGAKEGSASVTIPSIADSGITPVTHAHSTIDLTKTQTIPQGLQVTAMTVKYKNVTDMTDVTGYNFGIVQTQGTADTTGLSDYASGAQSVTLIVSPGLESSDSYATNMSAVNTYEAQCVLITVTDGTRTALVKVGDNGNQLKATADFSGSTATC
jgi:prepilin-type N-terminal cleavage/methylation domain-containing protein